MRRIVALTLVVCAFALGVVSPSGSLSVASATPGPRLVGVLQDGMGVFWRGGQVDGLTERATGGAPASGAECPAGPCFAYEVKLAEAGARLRVAIDVPQRDDSFLLTVTDPSGALAAETINTNAFDAEAFVQHPAAGTWTVAVTPLTAT